MKTKGILGILSVLFACLISCTPEDPGPIQQVEREFTLVDFDRLNMSGPLNITISQSDSFSIIVRGDLRNVDDLLVDKLGNTLHVSFSTSKRRQYPTYVTVTMPNVKGVDFGGATISEISGFNSLTDLDFDLSGASMSQLDVTVSDLDLKISGASILTLSGKASNFRATVSGASVYRGYQFEVDSATVQASGASQMEMNVVQSLDAKASGASVILYRGTPSVVSSTSGASIVKRD